jgi:hypothetical protein
MKIDQCLDFKMGRSPEIMRQISEKYDHLLKFFWNLKGQVTFKNRPVFGWPLAEILLDFKMGRSLEIMRPISKKQKRLLKFFWNLKGQVARKNKSVFEF